MSTESQFWWNWAVQIAIALGTVGAVATALFGEWLRLKLVPPKLHLRGDDDNKGTPTPVLLTAPNGTTRHEAGRCYYLKVSNGRRWSPVAGVQVFLLRVEEPDAAGSMQTTWVGEVPMRWRDQEVHPTTRAIGATADCDLCVVIKEKWLSLQTLIAPLSLRQQYREKCHLVLTLQARGVEIDSNILQVDIAWDGQWADGNEEMRRHLVVKSV